MKSGYFEEREGGYTIVDPDLTTSYEYNLLGEDILVCLDQNGIVKIQANPPEDILFLRRESKEKYSQWLTFVVSEGKRYCNFRCPGTERPKSCKISFFPEKAVYKYDFEDFCFLTTVFAPKKGASAVSVFEIKNISDRDRQIKVFAQAYPYMNFATLSAWDVPSWYLRTSLTHNAARDLLFYTRLMNPRGEEKMRRNIAFLMHGTGAESAEYFMERYVGSGNFYAPDALDKPVMAYDFSKEYPFGELGETNSIAGFQPVYAAEYSLVLKSGEARRFTQVLSLLDNCDGEIPPEDKAWKNTVWFGEKYFEAQTEARKDDYENLFSLNRVESGNSVFDRYVNAFLPLQMSWVKVLDRGWPTGMRGTRDAANDFMGALIYDAQSARKVLLHLFDCQRTDGWFPRQIGNRKSGPHDLRNYVDGGVFVLEFLYEYLAYTKEYSFFRESVSYLDSEEPESVVHHVLRALAYYSSPDNIGEDGLCKIREGDWFDGVNQAGIKGKGQSVTVSCQYVMAVRYVRELFRAAGIREDLSAFERAAELIGRAVREKAFNASGFFNGVKNDEGVWGFSDCDEDGETRMYAVPNAFAIFTGVAAPWQVPLVLKNFERMKSETGYKLFSAPFRKKLHGIGRVASGDVIEGLLGNYTVYNHGSQCFLARACAAAGRGDMAKEVLGWILPYDQSRHPEEKTKNPPYAIVNCYQDVPPCRHRTGFSFLTGTVAMTVRIIYNFIFGIHPVADGLEICPCLPSDFAQARIKYNYNGKTLWLNYAKGKENKAEIGGFRAKKRENILTERSANFIPEEMLQKNAEINITVR